MSGPWPHLSRQPPDSRSAQRVLDVLRQHEHELRARGLTRLAVFGSTARGDVGPKSDVDLLIELDPDYRFGLFAFLDLKDDLARLLERPVDLAFLDAKRSRLRAVGRCIEIISEASRRVPPHLKDRQPEIPWPKIAGIGNVLRHDDDVVNDATIWHAATADLLPLKEAVAACCGRSRRHRSRRAAQAAGTSCWRAHIAA